MQKLSQQQRLLLKLSPQQIQLLKLLQVPTALLDERIKEEIEENPALENGNDEDDADDYNNEDEATDENEDYLDEEGGVDNLDEINLSDYIKEGDDEEADYNFKADAYNPDNEDTGDKYTPRLETSFYETLINQLSMTDLDDADRIIAEHIIGSIDDDGYLRREVESIVDDLSFRQNIQTTETKVKKLIQVIQEFEPAGVAAKDLQECLLIQLNRMQYISEAQTIAIKVVSKYFDELSKKHYPKIQKGLNLSNEALKEVLQIIVKLNPKPGANFAEDSSSNKQYIIPDFIIQNNNGELHLTLNSKNAPDLRISSGYRDMLKDYEKSKVKDPKIKDAVVFLKQKLDSAKWFIDAIKQRQHTLYLVMETILKYQENFFFSGDDTDLRPMILKNISERTGLDISTISRVVNSKFVLTEFGTFSLKYFFSESLSTESGDEVSTKEVKKILVETVAAEDKNHPISDDQLTTILKAKGYNIARRTVAKYREQLNIAVARLRKQL
jgi:RNA polymerase sigma-54 factor